MRIVHPSQWIKGWYERNQRSLAVRKQGQASSHALCLDHVYESRFLISPDDYIRGSLSITINYQENVLKDGGKDELHKDICFHLKRTRKQGWKYSCRSEICCTKISTWSDYGYMSIVVDIGTSADNASWQNEASRVQGHWSPWSTGWPSHHACSSAFAWPNGHLRCPRAVHSRRHRRLEHSIRSESLAERQWHTAVPYSNRSIETKLTRVEYIRSISLQSYLGQAMETMMDTSFPCNSRIQFSVLCVWKCT